MDSSGCWTKGGKYVAPESLLPYLAQQIHSLGHSGPATMNHRFSNQWWNPKFRNAATETVKRCVTCRKNNDVPAAITPAAHTPAPPGPFRHLQVDYISLPPCKGKTDVLVVIDKFSRWVEAYPTRRATAAHTAKCLVTDFIPRWGLPDCIDSDQGTHFTGQVVKEVSRMLKIKWNLHCPYRPQASGQVERSNRTIKTRLSKMHQEGVPWVEALPAVLCSMRASPNRSVGLSPHEIITGRPMQMPGVIDLRNADVHIASDALIAYCENLTVKTQIKKARQRLYHLRQLRKFRVSPAILKTFYSGAIESVLSQCISVWYNNATNQDCKALQRVVRLAERISGSTLPSLQDIYLKRCKSRTAKIIKDSNHPGNHLFILLPSGRRYRSMLAKTERLKRSFFPQAIRLLNSGS